MNQIRPALMSLALLTVLTGIVYPLLVTGVAQAVFPTQANGSIIMTDGKAVGSTLIGQPFDDPKYFWGRLSATGPFAYNAGVSSGSNYGPLNDALLDAARVNSSDLGRAIAQSAKSTGLTLAQLESYYAQKLLKKSFDALSEAEKNRPARPRPPPPPPPWPPAPLEPPEPPPWPPPPSLLRRLARQVGQRLGSLVRPLSA